MTSAPWVLVVGVVVLVVGCMEISYLPLFSVIRHRTRDGVTMVPGVALAVGVVFLFLLLQGVFFSFYLSGWEGSYAIVFLVLHGELDEAGACVTGGWVTDGPVRAGFVRVGVASKVPGGFAVAGSAG